MLRPTLLPTVLAVFLASVTIRATPIDIDQDLVPRGNHWNLNCSNAPGVTAGSLVNASDSVLATKLPPTGSNQLWMKYLWCTVTTETYVFFDFSIISPYPKQYVNFYQAYTQAAQSVHDHIAQSGDGPLDRGYWWMQPPNTNVDVFVQDSVGHMTYGILASTLDGLAEASLNYNKANYPMVFQVNDGKWGEVGIGGAGMVIGQGADQVCYYQMDSGGSKPCIDIENRKVIN